MKRIALPLLVLLASTNVQAQSWWQTTGESPNFQETPKVDPMDPSKVVLPPYPKDADLVQYDIGETAWNKAYVDITSISIGADNVVRYVLVMKTPEGTINASYEGIRCDERQRIAYAYGATGGTWHRPRDPKWRPIERSGAQGQYWELTKYVFCDTGVPTGTPAQMATHLKQRAPRQ